MGLFLSTFVNKIDKKGRVSVPASFRAALANVPEFQGVVIFSSFTKTCIDGCGMDYMMRLSESAGELGPFSQDREDLEAIFSDAHQLLWDPEGRIALPERLIHHAKITDTVMFAGKGQTFQIWEPSAHEEEVAKARTRVRDNRLSLPPLRSSQMGGR